MILSTWAAMSCAYFRFCFAFCSETGLLGWGLQVIIRTRVVALSAATCKIPIKPAAEKWQSILSNVSTLAFRKVRQIARCNLACSCLSFQTWRSCVEYIRLVSFPQKSGVPACILEFGGILCPKISTTHEQEGCIGNCILLQGRHF